ncbi:MAG: cytochrome c biogenesis protein CcdA [Chitinophagales bacterium]
MVRFSHHLKFLALVFSGVLVISSVQGQYANPNITWSTSSKKISDDQFSIILKATIAPGFHLYSQFIGDGGPIPTSFTFEKSSDYKLIGKVKESGNRHEAIEPLFDNMKLIWFEDNTTFTQQVKILKPEVTIKGSVNFMTCNDKMCDPPSDHAFELKLKGNVALENSQDTLKKSSVTVPDSVVKAAAIPPASSKKDSASASVAPAANNYHDNSDVRKMSALATFLKGFGLGLVALTFPCVWPVIPLTVSYFLKNESKKRRGRMNAVIYALSIVVIFVVLGVLVSLLTNGQKLNELSTGWFFNILFFVLFFLFGLSFLGVFEIRMPSGLINRSEAMSEHGGLIGIFFMAFTLVLVSFSCTLPFIGNLIDIVSHDKTFAKPIIGFTAFGLALGLPFGILAMFPAALHRLPKSGHWMHVLKVTFGFLEIALSLIYLSKVDMAYHWGILSRDIFLAVWIILSAVLGLYLLNKIKLTAEDDDKHISVGRLLVAMFFLAFALYMTPGLWGSPLTPLSGFLPNYTEFSLPTYRENSNDENSVLQQKENQNSSNENSSAEKKYGNLFQAPLGLNLYFDYDDALAHARAENKPLFIDFTGWGCVNCRKMEKSVWPDPGVLNRLKNDYVTASLYVDDRTPLPDKEKYFSKKLNKEIETLGDKNFDLQYSKFDMGAQPYYVLLDDQANLLARPRGYTPDPLEYAKFLDEGLAAFRKEQVAQLK